MRAALAFAALLLVAAPAAAQMVARPVPFGSPVEMVGGGIIVELATVAPTKSGPSQVFPWLVVGHDNIVNLTLRNQQEGWVNATFRLNLTGATASVDDVEVSVAPWDVGGASFVVHPDDVGLVKIDVEAIDAFQPGGSPIEGYAEMPALLLPSVALIDPPPPPPSSEDDEFVRIDNFGGGSSAGSYIRLPPGGSVQPRLELHNPFPTTIAGFRLRIMASGATLPPVDVEPLDAGETRVIELPEHKPVEGGQGQFYGGMVGRFELRPIAEVVVGGATMNAGAASFALDRGAVVDVRPTYLTIDVQDGLVIDLYVPTKPQLGAPTRILYNFTNLQTTTATGRLTISLTPPSGLYYEVQGPESHAVPISLPGGEKGSGSIDFTPRVSGSWVASSFYLSDQSFGSGSGGGFEVPGPVTLAFDQTEQVYARIGEAIDVGVVVATSQPLQDAQLRIASGGQYYRGDPASSGGQYQPGFAQDLIRATTGSGSLGTLRPGGTVNTSIELVARSSGSYNIVPYVLAEGFAYTSTIPRETLAGRGGPIDFPLGQSMLNVLVLPREIPAGLSLAPLTMGLAFFVGVWTLRTRFVK